MESFSLNKLKSSMNSKLAISHFSSEKTLSGFGNVLLLHTNSPCFKLQSSSNDEELEGFNLAKWFDPNTRGGVTVWSILLISIPLYIYNYFTSTGLESYKVGAYVGAAFVLITNLLWASTYIFRVANKDMTYAKQLRDYENAVLQKRLEELGDDEINALMEEIEKNEDPTKLKISDVPESVTD